MKYLKLYESYDFEETIITICKYGIQNYIINTDGSIDVDGDVNLYCKRLTKLPLKFNIVNGGFFCGSNKLISLEGSPIKVNGQFDCSDNQLTSFEYAPKRITLSFNCRRNNIKSFEYFPSYVEEFYCDYNPIWQVWKLFKDWTKIELLNDFDIFRDEDTDKPSIFIDRLNDFLETIGGESIINGYKII